MRQPFGQVSPSRMHAALQPSSLFVFPSSHVSPVSTILFPQTAGPAHPVMFVEKTQSPPMGLQHRPSSSWFWFVLLHWYHAGRPAGSFEQSQWLFVFQVPMAVWLTIAHPADHDARLVHSLFVVQSGLVWFGSLFSRSTRPDQLMPSLFPT